MSNAIIGYPIWSDDALLYGGGWAGIALSHMQTEDLSDVARSTSATTANTQFDADHGAPVVARAIAYVKHNMSKAAKVKMRASHSIDFGLLAPVAPDISKAPWTDSGTPVVTAVAGPDGELSGYSINDNDAGGVEYRIVPLSTSGGNGTKSFGIWIKKGTATVSVIQIRDTTAGANVLLTTITWVGTTPGTPAMTTGSYVSQQVAQVGLWYYLTFTTASVTAANTNQLWLYGATATAGTTGTTLYAFPGYCTRNLVPSSDISGGSWSDGGSPTVSATTGPLGATDGYVIYDDQAGSTEYRIAGLLYASNGQKALNVWIKKGSASVSEFKVRDTTAGADRLLVTVTWSGTSPGTPTATTGTYIGQTAGSNGWYLLRFLTTSITAASTNQLWLYGATSSVGTTGTTVYALPWTEDDTVCYEDRYNSGWIPAYRQAYAGPSNLLDAYQAFDSWTVSGTPIVRRGYADPLGGQRAFVLEDDTAGAVELIYRTVQFLVDGTKTVALYVKQGSLTAFDLGLYDDTVGTFRHQVRVTFSADGVPSLTTLAGGGTLNTVESASCPGWYRISFTATGIISAHAHNYVIYGGTTAADTGTVYIFQPWAEDAESFATAILQTGEPGYTDGKVTQASLDADYPFHLIHVLPSNVLAQYWRTEIDDTANADGYVQIGRLMIAFGYEASIQIVNGAQMGWTTTSSFTETDGGADYVLERARRRESAFTFENMANDEALVRHHDFIRAAGIHEQVLWIPEPDATLHAHRENYPCRLRELQKLQKPFAFSNTQVYATREIL